MGVKAKPNRQNPNTTTGVTVTAEVLEQAALVQNARNQVDQQRLESKENAETKRVEQRKKRAAALMETLQKVWFVERTSGVNWGRLVGPGGLTTTPQLRLALQHWEGDTPLAKDMKAADLVALFKKKVVEKHPVPMKDVNVVPAVEPPAAPAGAIQAAPESAEAATVQEESSDSEEEQED